MGMFSDVLRKMANFLSDAESSGEPKIKTGIEELAAKRLQALQGQWEMVEAQVRLAAQSRRDLQKLVAEAKAVEAIGKQAMLYPASRIRWWIHPGASSASALRRTPSMPLPKG